MLFRLRGIKGMSSIVARTYQRYAEMLENEHPAYFKKHKEMLDEYIKGRCHN